MTPLRSDDAVVRYEEHPTVVVALVITRGGRRMRRLVFEKARR